MIEPIKPGHELFPYDVEVVDGKKTVVLKKGWNDEKQVAFILQAIEYLLQFEHNHGSVSMINMIEGEAHGAMLRGTEKQKERFGELMALRQSWLEAQQAA
ncbi:hypothetical protein ACTZWT_07745 [Rhodopseudomonas sp. NSM]|uniref:hypothetical protein n=1 Tax=Rhodopseudomonas sp. NSM TaxID=3457630 RepID=UPI004036033A